MSLQRIINGIANLPLAETRKSEDTYLEVVFFTTDLPQWMQVLTQHLGEPIKPPGTAPSADDKALTKSYGGIAANQTLFRGSVAEVAIVAMCWPWQDGEHVTLKIAKI